MNSKQTWWKEAIVYQIYPRSFQDSNGDGIGDLQGIIQRLDYVASLGVDIIWLNPIFESPNDDNGYDVSDYRAIMSCFGSMQDFEELVAECDKRKLKIILDLVPNHSSDEHEWFQESRKSKNNPYRDFYYWKEPQSDGGPPNNWVSIFAPSAWELDPLTNEYYLHLFSKKQPDLNWENPKVRQAIYDIMHFWMQKGIAGFRIDVVTFISKNLDFPDLPKDQQFYLYSQGPRLHEFLQEMNREIISKYDMYTVGEGPGIDAKNALQFIGEEQQELHTIYHFEHMSLDKKEGDFWIPQKIDLREFKRIVKQWDDLVKNGAWNTSFLGNHDFPRMLSRFGNDGEFHKQSAKLLAMFLLTQRATPYLYFGDEIGMTNTNWESLEKYRDLHVFDGYEKWKTDGKNPEEFIKNLKHTARDNGRTPMQWNTEDNAGFSLGNPWIDVNENYPQINVDENEKDSDSILNFYRKMIQFRKNNKTLIYGDYEDLTPEHKQLYIYRRWDKKQEFLILLNFSDEPQNLLNLNLPLDSNYEIVISNQSLNFSIFAPWQATLFIKK